MPRLLASLALVVAVFAAAVALAGDVAAPSAQGPQWQSWNPANANDLGSPAFKAISSNTMTLLYGFRGAVIQDSSTKQAERLRMVTITRSKVEGHVNQVNNNFALAAGLHEIAVYDFSKHKWVVKERVTPDDSTGSLGQNFVLALDHVLVRQLNGPSWKYTSAGGWQEVRR